MSQVITNFTGVDTTITAEYTPGTDDSYGFFIFGIQVQKAFETGVSFSTSVSLGDFSTVAVEESHLVLDGSFLLFNEFGVILGPDDTQGLKIIGSIDENVACSDQNLNFDIILTHNEDDPITHSISLTSCSDATTARVEALKSAVNAVMDSDDVTVSLVGSTSLILAFNPYWSKVETFVLEEYSDNVYALTNDTQKKAPFHFANGATALEIGLGLSGGATVSANVLDTIEVAASIDASISGTLQFNSGSVGQLTPLDTWFSNIKAMLNASDEFHVPDFASCTILVDGNFDSSVEVREPFALDVPASFQGSFASPFDLNLLDISAVSLRRPDIQFDIDLPNIGDIGNLSFGDVVQLLKLSLEFLVGDPDQGQTVESCSGGLLGKEVFGRSVFLYKIPILGISACEFSGFLQIVVDAIDQIVNDCSECNDPDAPKSTFTVLETKLTSLLQDAVGGDPSVDFTPSSDDIRSSLDVDLTLS
eukprot:scaffold293011_cov142-Cyclotella_meneghiniana.AAC.1